MRNLDRIRFERRKPRHCQDQIPTELTNQSVSHGVQQRKKPGTADMRQGVRLGGKARRPIVKADRNFPKTFNRTGCVGPTARMRMAATSGFCAKAPGLSEQGSAGQGGMSCFDRSTIRHRIVQSQGLITSTCIARKGSTSLVATRQRSFASAIAAIIPSSSPTVLPALLAAAM